MALKDDNPDIEVHCPICDAELIFSGDEEVGEEVFCAYCNSPFILVIKEDETFDVEEEF